MPTGKRSTSTTRRGATATASRRGSARAQAAEADEYTEVKGGGDFPDTWDFDKNPELVGTFTGSEVKDIKGKDRTIHTFEVDGTEFSAWGTAILDSRLADLDAPSDVKVIKTGKKIQTKAGRGAWEFQVFVKRAAVGSR